MGGWLALLATMAGAGITLAGQTALHKREKRGRRADLLLEQSAIVVALADDFRNRVWEEKTLGLVGRVEAFDLASCTQAIAHLRILNDDQVVHEALDRLVRAGRELGSFWIQNRTDSDDLDARWQDYKEACKTFTTASYRAVKHAQR